MNEINYINYLLNNTKINQQIIKNYYLKCSFVNKKKLTDILYNYLIKNKYNNYNINFIKFNHELILNRFDKYIRDYYPNYLSNILSNNTLINKKIPDIYNNKLNYIENSVFDKTSLCINHYSSLKIYNTKFYNGYIIFKNNLMYQIESSLKADNFYIYNVNIYLMELKTDMFIFYNIMFENVDFITREYYWARPLKLLFVNCELIDCEFNNNHEKFVLSDNSLIINNNKIQKFKLFKRIEK